MAVRTTAEKIGAIIEVDTTNIADLTPFITAANALVTQYCADGDYTVSYLIEIETWLAAHFYTVRDPRSASETVKGIGVKYQSKVDLGLNSSHYGQMAMRLDYEGGLAKMDKRIQEGSKSTVSVGWAGMTETEADEAGV